MRPKAWNDILALLILVIIPVLWVLQGVYRWSLPGDVNGGLLVTWSLIVQYYFRRAPPEP